MTRPDFAWKRFDTYYAQNNGGLPNGWRRFFFLSFPFSAVPSRNLGANVSGERCLFQAPLPDNKVPIGGTYFTAASRENSKLIHKVYEHNELCLNLGNRLGKFAILGIHRVYDAK